MHLTYAVILCGFLSLVSADNRLASPRYQRRKIGTHFHGSYVQINRRRCYIADMEHQQFRIATHLQSLPPQTPRG